MYVRLGRQPCQWKLEILSGSVVLDRFGKHRASASRDFCGSTEEKTRHRVGSRLWRTPALASTLDLGRKAALGPRLSCSVTEICARFSVSATDTSSGRTCGSMFSQLFFDRCSVDILHTGRLYSHGRECDVVLARQGSEHLEWRR